MSTSQPFAYLAGYSGHRAAELFALADALDLVVVDARWSPRSRVAEWSGGRLRSALGDRYVHDRGLGNRNYKVSGIDAVELDDPTAGIATLREIVASGRRPVLLCLCRDLDRCHLSVVASELASEGWETAPLDWDATGALLTESDHPAQLPLMPDANKGSPA